MQPTGNNETRQKTRRACRCRRLLARIEPNVLGPRAQPLDSKSHCKTVSNGLPWQQRQSALRPAAWMQTEKIACRSGKALLTLPLGTTIMRDTRITMKVAARMVK